MKNHPFMQPPTRHLNRNCLSTRDPYTDDPRVSRPAYKKRVTAKEAVESTFPKQHLPLSPAVRTRQALQLTQALQPYLPSVSLNITVTDNRAVMISVKRQPKYKRYQVRLHNLFHNAPDDILKALVDYIVYDSASSSQKLNTFVEENEHRIRNSAALPRDPIRTQGSVHDLQILFDSLNRQYFDDTIRAVITWGRHPQPGRKRRSIRLGSYTFEQNTIRIHPGLDQYWVPRFYIAWVVYHEMLHAYQPSPIKHGRRQFHTPEFRAQERCFHDFEKAVQWEKRNVAALLCL